MTDRQHPHPQGAVRDGRRDGMGPTRLLRRGLGAVVSLAFAVGASLGVGMAAIGPATAGAEPVFNFAGSGWGHGVGMSQWGARGWAAGGSDATAILTHYYRGTAVVPMAEANDLRVLVAVNPSLSLSAGGSTTVAGVGTVGAGAVIDVGRSGNSIVLSGALNAVVGSSITVQYAGTPLRVSPPGNRFNHGTLTISLDAGGGLRAVVGGLSMNAYLRGLGEMPSSWPREAMRAQAIAGRSIAMTKAQRTNRWSSDYDLAAWLDGAYIGYEKEYGAMGANWNEAVDSTNGWVVTHGGVVASTLYSASSGGHTENSEVVWSSAVPYLRGVPDPADAGGGNPHAAWSTSFTGSQLGARLGIAPVTSASVSGLVGVSGRLDKAAITFATTSGSHHTYNGAQLRSLLGLKSTKFSVNGAAPAPNVLPIGAFDTAMTHNRSTVLVGGRAGDPNGPLMVKVVDTLNGRSTVRGTWARDGHFLDAWAGAKGTHYVCVSLIDNPSGQEVGLGCRQVVVK